ncbi:hypothetical protein ACFWPU_00965 [Streptomyces sp. NPDC058471]|uniref:hypothetical protein n=1 Tax=Streptomyces sp. NPDC058471 TaxID=3346516 RepID=UPI00364D28BC
MGKIYAFLTATRVKWDIPLTEFAAAFGEDPDEMRAEFIREGNTDYNESDDTMRSEDAVDEHGWVDRSWSPYVLHPSRNDVTPEVSEDEDSEDLAEAVRDALGKLEGGYEDNEDGTFYSADSYQPYASDTDDRGAWDYSYALHFTRKSYEGRDKDDRNPTHPGKGWIEEAWTPPKEMLS